MINKPPPFKGLKVRIPVIIPIHGGGLLIRGLPYVELGLVLRIRGEASTGP